ncbi:MAG: hypothetical protein PHC51_06010 [bacterium]|nr:hypothetical protein [bacterium]
MFIKPLENPIVKDTPRRKIVRRDVDQIPFEAEEPQSIIDAVDLSGHLGDEENAREKAKRPLPAVEENESGNGHLDIKV